MATVTFAGGFLTSLTQVMPGVKWHKWTPYFMEESESLIDTWTEKVRAHLNGLPRSVDKVSSRSVKASLVGTEKLSGMTWTRIMRRVLQTAPSLLIPMEHGGVWKLEGQSLIRMTAESYGFEKTA